jgi:hypothetical protein
MTTRHEVDSTSLTVASRFQPTRIVAIANRVARIAAVVALLATAVHSTAAIAGNINYEFTYTDTFGVRAWGTLTSSSTPTDGSIGYFVTGGSITVATPASAVAAINPSGTEQLNVANGTYPLLTFSPPGVQNIEGDTIDNLVYPGNNAGSGTATGVSSPSYITTNGIEFAYPVGSSPNHEDFIGIFAYGNNNYALGWSPDGTHANFDSPTINRNGVFAGLSAFPGGGTFTLLVLPEPSSLMLLGVAGVLGAGYSLRRRSA